MHDELQEDCQVVRGITILAWSIIVTSTDFLYADEKLFCIVILKVLN